MLQKIELKYGKKLCPVELPQSADILSIKEPVFNISKDKFKEDLLNELPANESELDSVSIVLADKTRLCSYKKYLPWLLDILHERGIEKQAITFFIAYGTHVEQSDEECLAAYGDIYGQYGFVHHDSGNKELFVLTGKTAKGTKIHIRKDILESDLIITFGALSHHYFAGYGGGRKLLFPGLGYKPDIYQNHRLFLDTDQKRLHPGCGPGQLANNPLAEDLKQIDAAQTPGKIAIHGILDSKGKVSQLIVGRSYHDFVCACKILDSFYKTSAERQYELVLASCGGFPKDINFIQAHKAINNAAMFVKDNGYLVVFAECMDGVGSDTFMEYFNHHGFIPAFKALEKNYKGNGGTALSMMAKTKRINIFLKTRLGDKLCSQMGMKKIETKRIPLLIKEFQNDMACIANASLLIR